LGWNSVNKNRHHLPMGAFVQPEEGTLLRGEEGRKGAKGKRGKLEIGESFPAWVWSKGPCHVEREGKKPNLIQSLGGAGWGEESKEDRIKKSGTPDDRETEGEYHLELG